MRWRNLRRSGRIEDRRRMRLAGPIGGVGLLVALVIALLTGINPLNLIQTIPPATGDHALPNGAPGEDPMRDFVSAVLGSTEQIWGTLFDDAGHEYREPTLVLFGGLTRSACGYGEAAMGPFYCPGDERVYIDLAFYDDLRTRFEAPGDFAQAYVIAHEVGHHVQHLLGTMDAVARYRAGANQAEANAASVRLELQADCYAGIWAYHAERAQHILEPGDVEEALHAASAIGDDRLQRRTQGTVVPESFTHGSSAQRVRWYRQGLETGDPGACDTFGGTRP